MRLRAFLAAGTAATCVLVAGSALAASAASKPPANTTTLFIVNSQANDPVGQGLGTMFAPGSDGIVNTAITATGDRNAIDVEVRQTDMAGAQLHDYHLKLAAGGPKREMHDKDYFPVFKLGTQYDKYLGMDFTAQDGNGPVRSCSSLEGVVSIEKIKANEKDGVKQFEVTFSQHCIGAAGATTGAVQFNIVPKN
jgi:hypothetical protein